MIKVVIQFHLVNINYVLLLVRNVNLFLVFINY